MAVFRIEKTRDHTVMSNYHLRDMSLSLKAKGLLSLTLHQLKQHGASLTNIEITEQNIKAFSAVVKKYDIDYALKKDPHTDPPHYYVFFKTKDKDQLQPAFKEFTAMTLDREKRPTIRERLAQAQEQTKTKHREREKVMAKDREVAR